MKIRVLTTVCALFLLAVASSASAVVLIDIDFIENDFATIGTDLNGVGGWTVTPGDGEIEVGANLTYPGYTSAGNGGNYVGSTNNAAAQFPLPSTVSSLFGPSGEGKTFYMSLLGTGTSGPVFRNPTDGNKFTINTDTGGGMRLFLEPVPCCAGESSFPGAGTDNGGTNLWVFRFENNAGADVINVVGNPDLAQGEPDWGNVGVTSDSLDWTSSSNTGYENYEWNGQGSYFGDVPREGRFDAIRIATTFAELLTGGGGGGGVVPGATIFEWNTDDLGSWSSNANWSSNTVNVAEGSIPNRNLHTAIFGTMITGPTSPVTNDPVTVNRVEFNNSTHSYAVGGLGSVNVAASTAAQPVSPTIAVSGTHQFQLEVNLQSSTEANIDGGSSLAFNNALNLSGHTLTKTGAGTLAINNKLTTAGGTVSIQQGTVSGVGTIGGDVINDGGIISPGDSLGAQSMVPEPAAALLLGLGLLWGLGLLRPTGERHKSRFPIVTTVCALFLLAIASPASAVVLIDIDFAEGNLATIGTDLNGVGGWTVTPGDGEIQVGANLTYPGYTSAGNGGNYVGSTNNAAAQFALPTSASALFGPSGSGQTFYMSLLGAGTSGSVFRNPVDSSKFTINTDTGGGMRLFLEGAPAGSGESSFAGAGTDNGGTNLWMFQITNNGVGNADTIHAVGNPDLAQGEPDWGNVGVTSSSLSITSSSNTGYENYEWNGQGSYFGDVPREGRFDAVRIATTFAELLTGGEGGVVPGATIFEWNTDDLGSWSSNANWSSNTVNVAEGSIPNRNLHTAIFGTMITAPTSVVTHDPVTVNRVEFNNSTHSYAILGFGNVNVAASTAAQPVSPTIAVSGTHQFQLEVNLQSSTEANIDGGSSLAFNNALNLSGHTLTKTGAGTLAINNKLTTAGGTVSIQQGTVSGVGTIGGDVINDGGTISPGDSLGTQSVVPEPATALLLGLGLMWGLGLMRSMRQRHKN